MKDRIVGFIEEKNITAAEFADRIGVQRSSVSHVLNGRNNPGFSFIQKIIEAYPELNSRWLITGEGEMFDENPVAKEFPKDKSNLFSTMAPESQKETVTDAPIPQKQHNQPPPDLNSPQADNANIQKSNKKVTRVLIFYDDQTFEDFRPSQ